LGKSNHKNMAIENQNDKKPLGNMRQLGTVIVVLCIILFFILLSKSTQINGLMSLVYPGVLAVGFFFSGIAVTGKTKGGLQYLGFILALVLIVVAVGLLLKQ
jgi:hypothetical protein